MRLEGLLRVEVAAHRRGLGVLLQQVTRSGLWQLRQRVDPNARLRLECRFGSSCAHDDDDQLVGTRGHTMSTFAVRARRRREDRRFHRTHAIGPAADGNTWRREALDRSNRLLGRHALQRCDRHRVDAIEKVGVRAKCELLLCRRRQRRQLCQQVQHVRRHNRTDHALAERVQS